MNSLDSKITQYTYAINKLQLFIKSLKRLSNRENVKDLPLVHYIVLLSGNIFSINEALFNPRLEIISNFQLFKNTPITISSVVTHVPYDTPDLDITSLSELPPVDRANKCLKLLELLCFNCLQAYQKRLQQAKIERASSSPTSAHATGNGSGNGSGSGDFYATIDSIIKTEIIDTSDLDLELLDSQLLLNLPLNQNLLNNEDFVEATLIDMDIRILFSINSSYQKTLESLKEQISRYTLLKKLGNPEKQLQLMDGSTFVLHKLCALAIRLNELYIIFRKIGRKVYFSNFEHLYDTKLHFQLKNQNYFKLHLLKDMDEMFNSTRKNGTLLATLTRFFRQGAIYEVNAKNVLDFTNFINQGHMMLLGCLTKQEEFSFNWLATELRFRKVYGLPKKILTEVYTEVSEKNLPQKKVVNSSTVSNSTPVKAITTDLNLLTVDGGSRTLSRSSSRSSSINSQTSIPIVTPMKSIARRVNRNSMIIPSSLPTPNGNSPSRTNSITSPTRPQSMIFMNNNHSLTSLPLQKTSTLQQKLAAVDTVIPPNNTMAGRRRSNSQPIKPLENLALPVPISAAASGAASALKGSPAVNRSPSGSIKRSGSVSRSSPQPKPLIVVEEETVSKPAQLTANQRLQQHLKQAAKQGALMTQQRETFTSVLFDPNSPSSVNLRPPKSPNASEQSPQSSESLQSPQSLKTQGLQPPNITTSFTPPQSPSLTPSPVPKTRDQVTRMNTRRNSIHQNIPSTTSSLTSFSSESSSKNYIATVPNDSLEASSIPKRVRFTGVPEYSPAEDAPTSYSSRILKNFAVFKTPSPNVYKPGFKKKDQMLKKEESISFKTQLHNPTLDNSPTSTGGFQIPPANANPISTNRLSKLKSKLI